MLFRSTLITIDIALCIDTIAYVNIIFIILVLQKSIASNIVA